MSNQTENQCHHPPILQLQGFTTVLKKHQFKVHPLSWLTETFFMLLLNARSLKWHCVLQEWGWWGWCWFAPMPSCPLCGILGAQLLGHAGSICRWQWGAPQHQHRPSITRPPRHTPAETSAHRLHLVRSNEPWINTVQTKEMDIQVLNSFDVGFNVSYYLISEVECIKFCFPQPEEANSWLVSFLFFLFCCFRIIILTVLY